MQRCYIERLIGITNTSIWCLKLPNTGPVVGSVFTFVVMSMQQERRSVHTYLAPIGNDCAACLRCSDYLSYVMRWSTEVVNILPFAFASDSVSSLMFFMAYFVWAFFISLYMYRKNTDVAVRMSSHSFLAMCFSASLWVEFPLNQERAAHCDHPFVFLVSDQHEYAVFRSSFLFFDFEVYAFDFALFFSAFSE